jgi:hypothetical protein
MFPAVGAVVVVGAVVFIVVFRRRLPLVLRLRQTLPMLLLEL